MPKGPPGDRKLAGAAGPDRRAQHVSAVCRDRREVLAEPLGRLIVYQAMPETGASRFRCPRPQISRTSRGHRRAIQPRMKNVAR